MSAFTLTIDTDNAAFEGEVGESVATILEHVAVNVRDGASSGNVRDENGNTVGTFVFTA